MQEKILPVQNCTNRPLWSVMIPTYNCANLLRQTLRSVLAQDPGAEKMQIEVVDDVSVKDDPESVVREVGGNRVGFFRNPQNLGAVPNFNQCINRSNGQLIHILHGDDFVLPGFYRSFEDVFEKNADINVVACRSFIVDESSEIDSITPRLKTLEDGGHLLSPLRMGCPLQTPSVVVKRAFYESHGGFDERLIHTADWEMWLRSFFFGKGIAINTVLACYRTFSENDSSRLAKAGENVRDYRRLELVLKEKGIECDTSGFRLMCQRVALIQSENFKQKGDIQAVKANQRVWAETANWRDRMALIGRKLAALLGAHSVPSS